MDKYQVRLKYEMILKTKIKQVIADVKQQSANPILIDEILVIQCYNLFKDALERLSVDKEPTKLHIVRSDDE